MAVAALVLAVVSYLALGPLASIPGVVVAALELRAIRRGTSPAVGRTMALASLWICILNIAIFALLCGTIAITVVRTMDQMETLGPPR